MGNGYRIGQSSPAPQSVNKECLFMFGVSLPGKLFLHPRCRSSPSPSLQLKTHKLVSLLLQGQQSQSGSYMASGAGADSLGE